MKNRTTRLLSLLLALAMLTGLLPVQTFAEKPKVASSINIGYDAALAFVSTRFTGREATELLRGSITSPKGVNLSDTPGGWYVYADGDYTALVEKLGDRYLSLHNSDEPLRADGEYYFWFNIENTSDCEWDTENLPTITVNGAAPDAAEWRNQEPNGDVDDMCARVLTRRRMRCGAFPSSRTSSGCSAARRSSCTPRCRARWIP